MQDILSMIASLNRPRLLVQAARFGVDRYDRLSHLPRLVGTLALPRPGPAILRLIEIEASLNDKRICHAAEYSVARHVEVLIAIMGEARQLRAAPGPAETVAAGSPSYMKESGISAFFPAT